MYYRHEVKALASQRQLTPFIVLDIEPLAQPNLGQAGNAAQQGGGGGGGGSGRCAGQVGGRMWSE